MTTIENRSPLEQTPDIGRMGSAAVLPRLLIVGSFLPGFSLERYAGGNLAVEMQKAGGSVITTSDRRLRLVRLADMVWTAHRRSREYDLAHITVFSGLAFLYAEWVSRLIAGLNKPVTLSLHGGNLPNFARRHPKRVRRLLRSAQRVACPSGFLLEKLRPFRHDLELLPNAIHLARYPQRVRPPGGCRLLWLRAFHRIYRPEMALAVLAAVLKAFPRTTLTMVGPDKGDGSLQKLKAEIGKLKLEGRVNLPGAVSKEAVPQVMADHDVFLNTTSIDNTPVSVIEAMACGLPVVSTNVGGLPWLLEHGKTGLLVEAGDAEGMAAAVQSVLGNAELAEGLRERGRKLAESFDWQVVLPKWQRLFGDVWHDHRAGKTS